MTIRPPRRRYSKRERQFIFWRERGLCLYCRERINGAWEAAHGLARELMGSDDLANVFPAHPPCHKVDTRIVKAMVSKSNRVRRQAGLDPDTRKHKPRKIAARANPWPKGRRLQNRPFPKRGRK